MVTATFVSYVVIVFPLPEQKDTGEPTVRRKFIFWLRQTAAAKSTPILSLRGIFMRVYEPWTEKMDNYYCVMTCAMF